LRSVSAVRVNPQLRSFILQLFLDFCAICFPEWPFIFVSIIHPRMICYATTQLARQVQQECTQVHPKTLIEMWITCLDPVSANSERGRDSEWAVRVGQRLPSRFVQSGAARELDLVQIGSAGN